LADRYWVGGTANWDATAGTKWATTSGGAGGASVPTSADDVFFTNLSTGTCTIAAGNAGAKSINCTGFTGTIAGATDINIAGSVTLSTGMTWNYGAILRVTATGTITNAGKTWTGSTLWINATGGTVTLGDAFSSNTALVVERGTFTTNDYNVTAGSLSSSNSNTRTINLGSSTVTLSAAGASTWSSSSTTGLTFNAGTSQINLTSTTTATLAAGGLTFNNVSFTGIRTTSQIPAASITGANTFNNLSFVGSSSPAVVQVTFDNSQTINGTLSTTGTAGNRRVWFASSTYGVRRTLTVNSAPSLTDADFRDIIVNGTAAPIFGTRIGDLRGNSGITFDAPKTVYWNLAGTNAWTANAWASTSGGTPSIDNFPLAQDIAVINNSSSGSVIQTLASSVPMAMPTIDASLRTTAITLDTGTSTYYGDFKLGSGITITGSSVSTFSGRKTQIITSAGKTFAGGITIDSYGGTVELADALNIGSQTLTVTNGTFDTKNYNVTAGGLSSSNSNVRTIKLGSSTVTLSSTPVTFTTSTNLTFDAGTSTISATSGASYNFNGGGVTFYNVTLNNGGSAINNIIGSNTFNSLTITPPSSGMATMTLASDQTINGTITVAGASAVRRNFVCSNTIGTTRTITANAISANDCDFRDITIAGSAAGASPTRAGDCGGNTGITFPSPKTVYWNLSGSQVWGATAWATSSGGTPNINNYPLPQDTAVLDDAGSITGTITITGVAYQIGTLDLSGRTSAATLAINAVTVYGNFIQGSGVTTTGTQTITLSGRGTQTITSAGKTFSNDITVNSATGTVQLADALTLSSTRTLTLTSGTFDAVSYNVTTGLFSAASASTLKMGSGTWTLSGVGEVWSVPTSTSFIFNKGTSDIVLSNTTTTARTFNGNGLSYNKLTIGGATGTSTLTISGNNQFTELASTKTVAHTIALGTTTQTFGAWTVTGTAGNVVTLTGTGTNHAIAGSATTGIDYLAMGSIGFAGVGGNATGEFYAGANSTGTATAPVFRTATPAARTLYWVGGTGNWSNTARWSLSSGGAGGQAVPTSLDNVIFNSASNATAYTVTIDAISRCNQLTISAPASGNITLAGSANWAIHGNVTLPATGLTRTYTGNITLSGSTTGKTFTTNGVTLASAITVNGVGCGWSLGTAISATSLTITNGSFDTANYGVTLSSITTSLINSVTFSLGASSVTLSAGTPIDFQTSSSTNFPVNLTLNSGTSTINLSGTSIVVYGGSKSFYNLTTTSTSLSAITIVGENTFNNLSVAGRTSAGIAEISLTANQTINGTLTLSAGTNATMRTFVRSNTIGTTRTLTCNAVTATDVDFRDITIAGSAAPVSGTRLGDCKGNSGITFPAAKTVYWVQGSSANWSDTAGWSFTDGGSADVTSFPLAQDSAIFKNPVSGRTVTINASYNIGTIDMSARTTNTMTLANSTNTPTIYGNWINGTGTTLTGTGTMTFAGRGSQTITSAGVTFTQPITINSPTGTVQLNDSFIGSNNLVLNEGTFDANNYNFSSTGVGTSIGFSASGLLTKSVNIGSGTWTIAGSTNCCSFASNTVVTGTGTIILTSASAKTFTGGGVNYSGITLNQGGVGALTITGNNTFADITNTAVGATTIALGTTTQRVGNFTATGTEGNILTITGNTSNLIYTGGSNITNLDYLNVQGRAYGATGQMTDIWYAGDNSVNSGSLGWIFAAGVTPPPSANANFFLMFG
jgi:fibronectin-binding autotransporter adhesin